MISPLIPSLHSMMIRENRTMIQRPRKKNFMTTTTTLRLHEAEGLGHPLIILVFVGKAPMLTVLY